MMRWLGLDIGGANLKLADCANFAQQASFAMWKTPDELYRELGSLLESAPNFEAVALTMTGEMADCFATREEGVCRILEQVTRIIPAGIVRVFAVDGRWLSVPKAAREPWQVASSNWKALALLAARWTDDKPSLLIDIGSTTTDIIAIDQGRVLSKSLSDRDRLACGELVYTGIERSSIHGLLDEVTLDDQRLPIINEYFASAGDAHLILRYLDERPNESDTADGRPKTRAHAAFRLARVIGEDGSTLGSDDIEQIAEAAFEAQVRLIANAMYRVSQQLPVAAVARILISGHGDFLIQEVLHRHYPKVEAIHLSELINGEVSRSAPAHAVAVLAQEFFGARFSDA
jgi:(4-(4-[2-(gamma-L-glutamylamino)ethyl]phenoxymethyl)furan-2-yl)methanamine synthase